MAVDILELLKQGYIGEEAAAQEDDLNTMLAAGAKVEYPTPEPPGLMSQLLAGVVATPETAATLATGALALPISGYAGALAAPFVGMDRAAEIIPKVQEALTYQPKGEVAAESVELAMWPFEKIHESADWWGQRVADGTGSPDLGAFVSVMIEGGALVAAPGLIKGIKPGMSRLARKLRNAARTGNFTESGFVRELEIALAEARKDPKMARLVKQYQEAYQFVGPPPPGGPGSPAPIELPRHLSAKARTTPTANEIVRQRMAERAAAEDAGTPLPVAETGMRMSPLEVADGVTGEQLTLPGIEAPKSIAGMNPATESITAIPTTKASIDMAVAEMLKEAPKRPPTSGEKAAVDAYMEEIGLEKAKVPKTTTKKSSNIKESLHKDTPLSNEQLNEIISDIKTLYPEATGVSIVGTYARKTEVVSKTKSHDVDVLIRFPKDANKIDIDRRFDEALWDKWRKDKVGVTVDFLKRFGEKEPSYGQHQARIESGLDTPEISIWNSLSKRKAGRITFESQAEKHGVKFVEKVPEPEGVVGRYYDPETQQYFKAATPQEVGIELKTHRENVAALKQKYSTVSLEDFGRLVKDWNETGAPDINAIKAEIQKFINEKPKSDFPTAGDYMEFVERGEELLGIVNNMMRKKNLLPESLSDTPVTKLVVAVKDIDGKVYVGKPGETHAQVMDQNSLWDKALLEGQGFADAGGNFLTRSEALKSLPPKVKEAYLGDNPNVLESVEYNKAIEVEAKLNDGNISEPKLIEPKDRIAYMKASNEKISKLKQEQLETAIEQGVDITDRLPPEARNAYRTYKDLQEYSLESSEARGIGDIVNDVNTYLGEKGSLNLDIRKLSHEQRMALQRLVADAKKMVGDLTSYLESLGFNKEQIAMIRQHVDEIRKTDPESFGEIRQHWIDARAIAQGDTIVKQRKPGTGKQAPPVYGSEVKMMQSAQEIPYSRFGRGFETPLRTLEMADPTGEGLKQVYYDYRQAEQLYRREFEGVKKEIADMREGVGWGSRKRIGAYAVAQQARGKNILGRMGVEIPQLTQLEMSKYSALRGKFDQLFERINTVREMVGREKLEKVDNYFTFFRTFGVLERSGITSNPVLDKPAVIQSRYAKYGSTPFRFGIERIKKGAIPVELDPFRVYEKYMETALRHIHLSPWVSKMNELMLTLPDPKTGQMSWKLEASKPNLNNFLRGWVNHISGYPSNWQLPRAYEKGLSMINRNLAFSVLGANARSALIQVSALRNTITEIGFQKTALGIMDSITDIGRGFESRKFALENSKILDGRAFDAAVQDAMAVLRGGRIGAAQEALGRMSLKPLQWLDMETAIATWNGAFKLAKERGYNHKKSVNFADDTVTRTQASALPGDLAPIQRSVLGKTFTLFQTFVINDWNFLTRDVLGLGNVKISNDIALRKVMSYVAATTLFNMLYEAAGIQSPFPTPIRDAQQSIAAGDPAYLTSMKVAFGLIEPMPVIGSARYGKGPGGPTMEAIGEAVKSLRGAPMSKPIPEALATFTGIPGVTQAGKTMRAQKRGEGIYGQVVGRYEPEKPSLGRKQGLGGLKGLEGLSGL